MSNSKKITDLAAYTDSQVQSNDLLFITDIAAQETKKITIKNRCGLCSNYIVRKIY